MEDVKYLLWLTAVFGSDMKIIHNVLEIFQTAEGAYRDITLGSVLIRLTGVQQRILNNTPISLIEEKIQKYKESGITVTGINQPDYPKALRHIQSPPPIIYYKGDISCIDKKNVISCVGTRKPSGYTVSLARDICLNLARKGYTTVSGFAVGTDIICHLASADAGFPTACVLGCGINYNYPSENYEYREKILESGGVFISEFEPSAVANPRNFRKRNRILSALSKAVLVFEAAEESGSLVTADIAFEQGRKIFAIPPSDIRDNRYKGNINLLGYNAQPVYEITDITDFFDNYRPVRNIPKSKPLRNALISFPENTETATEEKKILSVNTKTEKAENRNGGFTMNETQKKIIDILRTCTLHKDIIIKRTNADIDEIALDLMELEIKGYIRSLPGNLFELK